MPPGTNSDVCNERHKSVDDRFKRNEDWLQEHEEKIDRLDRSDATNTQAISGLSKAIGQQTKAIWGLVGITATALLGFFVFAVEKGVFK